MNARIGWQDPPKEDPEYIRERASCLKYFCLAVVLIVIGWLMSSCSAAIDLPTPTATSSETSPNLSPTPQATRTFRICTVTAVEALNLRKGPGIEYSVTYWLRPGQVLTVLRPGKWAYVATAGMKYSGYINSRYCKGDKQ